MTIKDKIKEKLREGTSFAQIRREHESVSKSYEALREFLEESGKKVDERQQRLEDLKNAQMEEEEKLRQLEQENLRISQENEELAQLNERLTEEVTSLDEEKNRLNAGVEALSKKGYSPEIIQKITAIESRTGPQLLANVETAEKFYQTKKEFLSTKRKHRTLKKENQELQMEKTKLKKAVISAKNMLDELEIQTAAYEEAVVAVEGLLEEGYSVDDIKSLKSGLNHVQIRGDPKTSIRRLVEGLTKEKNLCTLEEKVGLAEKKLEVMNRKLMETEQKSEVVNEIAIKSIEDVKYVGLQAIDATAERGNSMMFDVARRSVAAMNEQSERFESHIQRLIGKVESRLKEYTEFQTEKSRFEETVYPILLLGSEQPQLLGQVPIIFVAEMLNKILAWVLLRAPEATVIPSHHIRNKDPFMLAGPHRLSVILELAGEGLKQEMIDKMQKMEKP